MFKGRLKSLKFNNLSIIFIVLLLPVTSFAAYKPHVLFYASPCAFAKISPNNTRFADFLKNSDSIDIIAAQDIHVKQDGSVSAMILPKFVEIAKKRNVKVIPVVVNMGFDTKKTSNFLHNKAAQQKAISNLLNTAIKYKLDGIQVDFEGVNPKDRDLFTEFYHNLSQSFHSHKLSISVAVIIKPINSYNNPYDYKKLADDSDFISLMAYDEHGPRSAPGPIASNVSDEKIIKRFLTIIPSSKISLGVPCYSGFWKVMSERFHGADISYQQAKQLEEKYNINWNWNNVDKVNHARFHIPDSKTVGFIYLENAKSFAAKVALAEKYNLHGVSAWRLGQEDPQIWNYI